MSLSHTHTLSLSLARALSLSLSRISTTVRISNLSLYTTEEQIHEMFHMQVCGGDGGVVLAPGEGAGRGLVLMRTHPPATAVRVRV